MSNNCHLTRRKHVVAIGMASINYNSHNPKSTSVVCPVGIDQKDPSGREVCVFTQNRNSGGRKWGAEGDEEVKAEREKLPSLFPKLDLRTVQQDMEGGPVWKAPRAGGCGSCGHLQEPFWALHKGWLQKKCGHTDEMFLGTSYDRVLESFNPEQNLDLRDSKSTWPK